MRSRHVSLTDRLITELEGANGWCPTEVVFLRRSRRTLSRAHVANSDQFTDKFPGEELAMELTPEERAIARRTAETASANENARGAEQMRLAEGAQLKAQWAEYLADQRSRDYPDSVVVNVCLAPRGSSRAWKASGRIHAHQWQERVAYTLYHDRPRRTG